MKCDASTLEVLAKRGMSLLRLSSEEWKALEETRFRGVRFSLMFSHGIARRSRVKSLVLIATLGDEPELRVGLIRSVQPASTFDSRVVFDLVHSVTPRSLEALLAQVMESALRSRTAKLARNNERFQAVSPKLGECFIKLIAANPDNTAVLQRIVSQLALPKRFDNARALQQDAVTLALKTFGVADGAASLAIRGDTTLGTIRLQEDAVIEHDARWIPGWRLEASDPTGRAVFVRGDGQLHVFTANKRPLEKLFGVDLIYLNQTRGALVMVQYKMMERKERNGRRFDTRTFTTNEAEEREWTVPIDKQFQTEIERMTNFDKDLSRDSPYRLNNGAFFFKLVKRDSFTSTSGIILSLGHLKKLIADGWRDGAEGWFCGSATMHSTATISAATRSSNLCNPGTSALVALQPSTCKS